MTVRVVVVLVFICAVVGVAGYFGAQSGDSKDWTSYRKNTAADARRYQDLLQAMGRILTEAGGCLVIHHDPKSGKVTATPCKPD